MLGSGFVRNSIDQWGGNPEPLKRNLWMGIQRTPHNVVREPNPEHVADWGRIAITPNGQIVSLGDTADDAVNALDKAGARGAAALGAGVGFIFSSNRIVGAFVGGLIGYFGGQYVVNVAKKAIGAAHAVSTVSSVVPSAKAG
jgi:hypothetical protein